MQTVVISGTVLRPNFVPILIFCSVQGDGGSTGQSVDSTAAAGPAVPGLQPRLRLHRVPAQDVLADALSQHSAVGAARDPAADGRVRQRRTLRGGPAVGRLRAQTGA